MRYNHNLQTSRRHFPNIIKTHSYDERLDTLHHLKSAGISVCSGALFGMKEDWADRLDLAFDLRAVDPDVVPLNFLIAIDGTPLQGTAPARADGMPQDHRGVPFPVPAAGDQDRRGASRASRHLQSWIFLAVLRAPDRELSHHLRRQATHDRQMVADLGLEVEDFNERSAPMPRTMSLPVASVAGGVPLRVFEWNGLAGGSAAMTQVQYLEDVT